jgi:hypothetical protein
MQNLKNEIICLAGKLDGQKIRFILFLVTIGLFVLAAGAPDAGGGIISGPH